MVGAANTHQRNFPLFLAAVLVVSVAAVAIFVVTASPSLPAREDGAKTPLRD